MPADAGGQTVQPAPPHAPRRDDVVAAQAVPVEAEADLDGSILDRHVGPAGAYPEQREHRIPPGIDADRETHERPPVPIFYCILIPELTVRCRAPYTSPGIRA